MYIFQEEPDEPLELIQIRVANDVKLVEAFEECNSDLSSEPGSSLISSPQNEDKVDSSLKRKRVRERDFCYYCETLVLNFARHILRNHAGESEVAKILSHDVNSKERKKLITSLRKKGNYLNYGGQAKPVRKPTLNSTNRHLPCIHCLGLYSAKQLWKHRRMCLENPSRGSHVQADAQTFLVRHLRIDEKLKEEVFPRMRADKISLVAKKDTLICAFGARYLKTHREKHFVNVTSRKMRELSKLLIEAQQREPTIKTLFDLLRPEHYDNIVEATKAVARYDTEKQEFEAPTYAMNISTSLKECCSIAILYALKKKKIIGSVYHLLKQKPV